MTELAIRKQLMLLKAEQANRAQSDGLQKWQAYRKQQLFIDAVVKGLHDEAWFIAANRSGKSDAGAYAGSLLARYGPQDDTDFISSVGIDSARRTRPTAGWVVGLDFPTLRDVLQPKYFDNGFVPPGVTHPPFIPNHEIESWTVSNQVLRLKNGSIIGFKSADSGRMKFQGSERDWIHFDEECPYEVYKEAVIRVGENPLKIFGTCTMLPPEGESGGVSWLYPHKIRPFLDDPTTAPSKIFGASIYDNPHLLASEITRLESVYTPGSVENRIRLGGEWLPGLAGARAYPGFSREGNVGDQLKYYNRHLPLAWCWDFNVEPMVCLVGQRDGKCFRVYDELIKEDGHIPSLCEQFYQKWGVRHLGEFHVYGDATGKNRTAGVGKTSYLWIMTSSLPIRNRIKLKVPEGNPHVVDRINAVNRMCCDEESVRCLQIDPRCPELVADMEEVLRDQTGGIKKTTQKKSPYFKRTHYSDALGYWLAHEAPVVSNPRLGSSHPLAPQTIREPHYRSSIRSAAYS